MVLSELTSQALIQRVIDILSASASPDLRLASAGGPIRKYIFGLPDENEIASTLPAIYVAPGGLNNDFLTDAGIADTRYLYYIATIQVGVITQDGRASQVEKNALNYHDDIRLALRKVPDLNNGNGALVERVVEFWPSYINRVKDDKARTFTLECAIDTRWLLKEQVVD